MSIMTDPKDVDLEMEDDYDEEADSDFEAGSQKSSNPSSSSEDDDDADAEATARSKKRRKVQRPEAPQTVELDSGDEATIQQHKRTRRKHRRKGEDGEERSGEESEGWRARTRAMKEREKEEKKRNTLASVKGSTIDVNKLWEEMNRPDFKPHAELEQSQSMSSHDDISQQVHASETKLQHSSDKENDPDFTEMITIKRTYKFAGEVHTEEKTVLKSSAEAQLWLAQQASKPQTRDAAGRVVHRPLRRISKFDPNVNNLDSFKTTWTAAAANSKSPTGPKLNVVEKSKMDWAVHVDAEGLKEELDVHAKAKEGYLNRMDFLRDVEQRKESEARAARLQAQ